MHVLPEEESSSATSNNITASTDESNSDTESDAASSGTDVAATSSVKETGSKNSSSSKKNNGNLFDVDTSKKSADPLEQGIDLKGYEFVIIDFNDNTWNRKTGVSKGDDARVKVLNNVEKKLNCKIKYKKCTYGKFYSTYQAAMLSGEKVADVLSPTMYEVGAFISGGLLTDVSKVPNLHLDKEYWNPNFIQQTKIKGKSYTINTSLNSHLFSSTAIYFNKSVLKDIGMKDTDLYNMVKKKEWTIDKFIELAKKAKKDIDGTAGYGANDRYGFAAPNWAKSLGLFMGSGINMLKENNGTVQFNFKPTKTGKANTEAIQYLNKLKQVCVNGDISNPVASNQAWTVAVDQFTSDKALFFLQMAGTVANPEVSSKFLNMKSDYGILPVPNAKVGDTYHNEVDWNTSAWIIPVTNKDLSKTGIILEALAYHSYYDYSPVYNTEWCDKYLRDDESAEMLSIIQKTPMYDLALLAGNSETRIKNIIDKIIVPSAESAVGGYDPAQAIPMYEDTIRKGIDEFFNN